MLLLILLVKLDFKQIYTAYGANLITLSAADALVIINLGAEVFNCYRTFGTSLYTLHTADTTKLALLSCLCALVVVFAKHSCLSHIEREQVDKISRAGLDAHFAGLTLIRVDSCNTVAKENGFIRTNCHTVTKADTAVNTVFGTAEKLCCYFAGLNAAVIELFAYVG